MIRQMAWPLLFSQPMIWVENAEYLFAFEELSWVYNYLYWWTDMEMQSNRYFCLLSLIVLTYIWLLSFFAIMNELITPFFNVIAISFSKFGSFLNLHCFTVSFYYWECSLCRTFSINRAVYWFYVLFNMSN